MTTPDVSPDPLPDPLIEQMRSRRAQLDRFLRRSLPQRRQLVNASILFSSAAPAFGGQAFTTGLTEALNLSVPSWRLLCGLASAASVVASVSTQLLQTSRLEALEQGLVLGQFDRRAATDALLLCIETTALLDPSLERAAGAPGRSR